VLQVLDITTNQDRALRKRALIADLVSKARSGASWGIMTEMAGDKLADALPVPLGATRYLASLRTRLDAFSEGEQCRLVNGGYALCDAAMRKYVVTGQPIPPPKWPYPACALDEPVPSPSAPPITPDPPSGR
jgi:NTE family protein